MASRRSIASYEPVARKNKMRAALARLEKRFDKRFLEFRNKVDALREIQELLDNKIIDKDHAVILRQGVEEEYQRQLFNKQRREKREQEARNKWLLDNPPPEKPYVKPVYEKGFFARCFSK